MKKKLNKLVRRNHHEVVETSPVRVTNENITAHREEVLGRARRFIYPLSHSKHKLVVISVTLLITALVALMSYCVLALYKFKTSSDFLYQITRVVPFPIARIGSDFVAYENYLFELNHYTHYYATQQQLDFSSDSGQQQLTEFRKRALKKVVNEAYVREIAAKDGISVSDQEVNDEIAIIRSQNRLGTSDKEFETVLRDFWDWSVDDFKRSLHQQLLNEKVIAHLDTSANQKATTALAELKAGKDFAELARAVSEDPATKDKGGDFGFAIDKNNRDISPKTAQSLFALQPGGYSEIINVGYGLQIVKNISQKDDKVQAAQIVFNFQDLDSYLSPVKDQKKSRSYVNF